MEKAKGNLNVLIFDDDQPSVRSIQEPRGINSSKHIQHPQNQHQYEVILQEIQLLSEKIKKLEQQTDNINVFKNESNVTNKHSMTNIEANGGHSRELLMTIEKKIQLIVKETKRIVDKLGQTFDKKLQAKLTKKYDEMGVNKVKQGYLSTLKKVEQNYKRELDRLGKQYKQAQNKMVNRVGDMEQRLINRMKQFQTKEKEYIDWIHHLEAQLQQKQQKSKKMIEITQDRGYRKQITESSSVMTQHNNNADSYNFSSVNPQKASTNINDNKNDNSRVNRKHKIFDNTNKGSSVSPNHKTVSPHTQPYNNTNAPLHSTKVINPTVKVKVPQQEIQKQVTISLATKATNPLKNNFVSDNDSSPWRVIDKSIEINTKRNEIVKDVNEDEFYKDLPKASVGWQKFQDFKENDASSSDSEEDVLFYREGDRHQQFLESFKPIKNKQEKQIPNLFGQSKKNGQNGSTKQIQQKVFSPFDLN